MKQNNLLPLAIIATSLAFYSLACTNKPQEPNEDHTIANTNPEEIVKRGEYLVAIMGCNDCHSPKKAGPNGPEIITELLLSGYPAERPIVKFTDPMLKEGFAMFYPDLTASAGPWGMSFAGNITPDETGIGNWTEEQFKKAIMQGKFKGLDNERMLLPPMPWFNYAALTDEDASAIFAYLMSIKPVKNVVPAPISPDKM
jgi:mono/diheme cytochrome c family protein